MPSLKSPENESEGLDRIAMATGAHNLAIQYTVSFARFGLGLILYNIANSFTSINFLLIVHLFSSTRIPCGNMGLSGASPFRVGFRI